MDELTPPQPPVASVSTESQPAEGTDTATLMRQLLAALEQQRAGSSQSAGEHLLII